MKVRSGSEEQTVTDFIIVTAMQLLNDTEPGRIIFPISYSSVVPGNFGLNTHIQLLWMQVEEKQMCCGDSPRARASIQPVCVMNQPAERWTKARQS